MRTYRLSRLALALPLLLLLGLTGCGSAVPTAANVATPAVKAATPTDMPAPTAAPVPDALGLILYANDSGLWTLSPSTLAVRQALASAGRTVLASPAVSPDGRQVAYSQYDPEQGQAKRDNGVDLYLMDSDGTDARVLLAHDEVGLWLGEPAWLPDGKSLLYTRRDATGKEVIERLTLADGKRAPVVQDAASPTVARDGQRLAYLTTDPQSYAQSLWVADIDGGNAKKLLGEPQFEALSTARFSPDGRRIAFVAIGGPDQQPPRTAAAPAPAADALAWLRPATAAAHGILYNVWTVNSDGTDLRRLTLDLEVEIPVLAWSPDGRWLVFESDYGLNLVSADGKEVRYLAKQSAVGGADWYAPSP